MRSTLKFTLALRPDWEVCGEAAYGGKTVAKPNLTIMDFKMPLADDLEGRQRNRPNNAQRSDSYVHPLQN